MSQYAVRLPDGRLVCDPSWRCVADVVHGQHALNLRRPGGDLLTRDHDTEPWRLVHPAPREDRMTMPTVSIGPRVRLSLYLIGAVGSIVVTYLVARGWAGDAEYIAWGSVAGLLNVLAASRVDLGTARPRRLRRRSSASVGGGPENVPAGYDPPPMSVDQQPPAPTLPDSGRDERGATLAQQAIAVALILTMTAAAFVAIGLPPPS